MNWVWHQPLSAYPSIPWLIPRSETTTNANRTKLNESNISVFNKSLQNVHSILEHIKVEQENHAHVDSARDEQKAKHRPRHKIVITRCIRTNAQFQNDFKVTHALHVIIFDVLNSRFFLVSLITQFWFITIIYSNTLRGARLMHQNYMYKLSQFNELFFFSSVSRGCE